MKLLSKSKLLAYRQCQKRLWLELYRPELRVDSAAAQANFETGFQVGDIARRLYDPTGTGALIALERGGIERALQQTQELLASHTPIFEAGFSAAGAVAFADVLLPVKKGRAKAWRMVEVKSATSVKDYHRDDAAIQAYVARQSGVALQQIALAHIDSTWVYGGDGDYNGLLTEVDLTDEAFPRENEVAGWLADAKKIAATSSEPKICTGEHCTKPYPCGFLEYCESQEPQAEIPVYWLPRIQAKALKAYIADNSVIEMSDVPDSLLNDKQLRIKHHHVADKPFFDQTGAEAALKPHALPAIFLDFETTQAAVPRWAGTRPYQQIPFQFSAQRLATTGQLVETAFLDLSGNDPSRPFSEQLIVACGKNMPIFVYNAAFEKSRIKELAERFPDLAPALTALLPHVVDLLPIAETYYYHPSQQGSWSIKKVLPAVAPELSYGDLEGIQGGGMAMQAYVEAIAPDCTPTRKQEIDTQLRRYCGLDTFAMVKLWQAFANRADLRI